MAILIRSYFIFQNMAVHMSPAFLDVEAGANFSDDFICWLTCLFGQYELGSILYPNSDFNLNLTSGRNKFCLLFKSFVILFIDLALGLQITVCRLFKNYISEFNHRNIVHSELCLSMACLFGVYTSNRFVIG